MKFIDTKIEGCYIIEQNHIKDIRGLFVKMFQKSIFLKKSALFLKKTISLSS